MTQQSDLATMFLLTGEGLKISYYINEDQSSELDYQDAQGASPFRAINCISSQVRLAPSSLLLSRRVRMPEQRRLPWCYQRSSSEGRQNSP